MTSTVLAVVLGMSRVIVTVFWYPNTQRFVAKWTEIDAEIVDYWSFHSGVE